MKRMLDAGEELFFEGGSPALTLEAVIERAQTSTGSFYARFGDMHGFLEAMHERVLTSLTEELQPVFAKAAAEADLRSMLHTFCADGFEIIHRRRAQAYFFAVGNAHDSKLRAMGSQFQIAINDELARLMKRHLQQPTGAAARRRITMAVRMINAATFQQIMFDEGEVTRLEMSRKQLAAELADMVSRYLLATPPR